MLLLIALLSVFVSRASAQDMPPLESFDEAVLTHLRKQGFPGGALAVVREGRLVYARGYGWADVEAKAAVEATSLFRLASLSKPITAVAVLTLVRKGKLDLGARAFSLLEVPCFSGHLE